MLICGIDENGRGAVIGPMVICGVIIEEKKVDKLREIGVKDSKKLSKKEREELSEEIREIADQVVVLKVPPSKIDGLRRKGINLNQIEIIKIAEIINFSNASVYYIDALTTKPKTFEKKIKELIKRKPKPKIVAQNHLDETNAVVSAASIIGKVERDKEIEKIKKREGVDFGVGYPHDQKTREFLKIILKKYGFYPEYVRKTWLTSKDIKRMTKIKSLKNFLVLRK